MQHTDPPVLRFTGKYRFLSNFHPAPVTYKGERYLTVEHAYQASKTNSPGLQEWIRNAPTPSEAKKRGRRCGIRGDFDLVRVAIMRDLLRQKFAQGTPLAGYLLATRDACLVEGNTWGDVFWGVDERTGQGENMLGKLLMQIRNELKGGGR